MSKFSPICISDSDDSDCEDAESKTRVFMEISDDEEQINVDRSTSLSVTVKSELVVKPEPVVKSEFVANDPEKDLSDTELTPRKRLTLNKKRLTWLSCKINVSDIRARSDKEDKQTSQAYMQGAKANDGKSDEESDDFLLTLPFLESTSHDIADVNTTVVKKEISVNTEEKSTKPTECKEQNAIHDIQARPSNVNENIKQDNSYSPSPSSPLDKQEQLSSKLIHNQSPKSSPLKYDTTEPRKQTPKKKTPLERYVSSPRKTGVFGSPSKDLKQTTLNKESFSPKKQMTSSCKRLDDNSGHNPPLHANQFSGYGGLDCTKKVQTFTYSQLSYLEGIEEEGHQHTCHYIDAIIGLVTPYRKPPPDLCFRLLEEKLLNAYNKAIAMKTYSALKRIQAIHPVVLEQMLRNVKFEFFVKVVERLELLECECKKECNDETSLCLKAFSALNTLTLLVDLMQKEAKRKMTPYKTLPFRLVSLERNSAGVTKILSWINSCVKLCCNLSNHHDYTRILTLFQSLLHLSISVSENPDKCAEDLAEELLNSFSQLPTLECRTVFLQTLQSHLLRSKFLLLYIDVFCERSEPSLVESRLVGIQRIIQSDFCRLPLKRDDVVNFEVRMCSGFHRSEQECEEHAMVIAYSLQSYLFCHHKKLQNTPKKLMLNRDINEDSEKGRNRRHLSVLDQDEIVNMGDKVQVFAGRLLSLCPALTRRTTQLVELLSDMRVWDPW